MRAWQGRTAHLVDMRQRRPDENSRATCGELLYMPRATLTTSTQFCKDCAAAAEQG